MEDKHIDPQLLLFRRQYLQLFDPDFLTWPPKVLLKDTYVQAWIFRTMFDVDRNHLLPPVRYQYRVLKKLMARIEQSIDDPEEDEISDDLMSRFSTLVASALPSETDAVQQRSYVTFSCLPSQQSSSSPVAATPEPIITLLERRHLISGSKTTGFRTWEAALHLGTYLLTEDGQGLVRDKNIFELGMGTGFLSILCAKHLGARHVTSTDGDEGVVEAMRENLFLNNLDKSKQLITSVLRWGQSLRGTWVEEVCEEWPYDTVIGADITYDKIAISALVATFDMLFVLRPEVRIIIAGAVRNAETFETFRHACVRRAFNVKEIHFDPKPMREQNALFYATAVPLKILSITRPEE